MSFNFFEIYSKGIPQEELALVMQLHLKDTSTHTKISKLVASLQRSCQQDKLYSHGLFQVVNKFETSS